MAELSQAVPHAFLAGAGFAARPWAASEHSSIVPIRHSEDAQQLAVEAAAQSEERFRQLAESVNEVFWIYEPERARFAYVSPAYEREWVRSAKALYADSQQWLEPVHPDDRESLEKAFSGLADGTGYAIEYRASFPGADERWIAERTVAVATRGVRPSRFAGVSQDITVRKKAYLELLRTDRRKDEFLATLAHELRNPLGPIRSAAAVLARQHAGAPTVAQKAVSIIERQVSHLTRLVDDLLDVSRINHGKVRMRCEAVRLEEVIDAAVESNRLLAETGAMRLRVELPECDVWVLGDAVRLTQVFGNLLHNAIKFSAVGGIIEIRARLDEGGEQVSVSVRDEGAGMASDLIDSLFDIFMQEQRSLSDGNDGLGIGLSVVRKLTEMHGGKVSAQSGGVGKGSEFMVTLPTTHAPQPIAASPVVARARTIRRILVVDDNRDAAETLQVLLAMEGHSVSIAASGGSALEQAARLKPDAIILDIGLPDMLGHDVARRIRAESGVPAPLFVALTGTARARDCSQVLEAGFDHYLVKPADPAMLMRILSAADSAVHVSATAQTSSTQEASFAR